MANKLKNLFFVPVEESVPGGGIVKPVMPENIPVGSMLQVYEQEFDKLNLEGLDFYEFMKAINRIEEADPKTYQVIQLTLGLDKAELIEKAKFYVGKLQEFHVANDAQIKGQLEHVKSVRNEESAELLSQRVTLEEQLKSIQAELSKTTESLNQINSKHDASEDYLLQQAKANDAAKEAMVGKITTIVEGIKSNIK